jgi:hypothetical protein
VLSPSTDPAPWQHNTLAPHAHSHNGLEQTVTKIPPPPLCLTSPAKRCTQLMKLSIQHTTHSIQLSIQHATGSLENHTHDGNDKSVPWPTCPHSTFDYVQSPRLRHPLQAHCIPVQGHILQACNISMPDTTLLTDPPNKPN